MDIKLNHIYRYLDNENTPLCICMCRTQSSGVYLIVPLTDSESDDTYKLSITDQYANIGKFKEINVSQIIGPLYLKSKHVKIPINDIVYIQFFEMEASENYFKYRTIQKKY